MHNCLQEDLGGTFRGQVTKGSHGFSQNILWGRSKNIYTDIDIYTHKYIHFYQMMECFSFILKFVTDQFSIESFSPLFRFSNLTHALKAVVIPGFQELLTIMLLLRGNKGAHHLVIRCLTVLTYLSCLPIFPPDTGTAKLTQISFQPSPDQPSCASPLYRQIHRSWTSWEVSLTNKLASRVSSTLCEFIVIPKWSQETPIILQKFMKYLELYKLRIHFFTHIFQEIRTAFDLTEISSISKPFAQSVVSLETPVSLPEKNMGLEEYKFC